MAQRKRAAGRGPGSARTSGQSNGTQGATDIAVGQVIKRPAGYYWLGGDSGTEFGPYPSYDEALADLQLYDGEAPEPGESLQEAESELGIADWIDPDTGRPAEGWSTPHLSDD